LSFLLDVSIPRDAAPLRPGPGRNETTAKIAIGSMTGTFFANAR